MSQNGKDPSQLLNRMVAEWEELDYPEKRKLHKFYSALDPKVRGRVDLK